MATDIAALIAEVKLEANRGSSLDSQIPKAIRRAAMTLEKNYSFLYMQVRATLTVTTGTLAHRLTLPARYKETDLLRIVAGMSGDDYVNLNKVHPQDQRNAEADEPCGYYLEARNYIWLDCEIPPATTYSLEHWFYQFTDWPSDIAQSPWLVVNAEELLIPATMLMLAPYARAPEWNTLYQPVVTSTLKTLIDAEEAIKRSQAQPAMIYRG